MILEMTGMGWYFRFKIITGPSFLADNIYFNQLKDFLNMERPNIDTYIIILNYISLP